MSACSGSTPWAGRSACALAVAALLAVPVPGRAAPVAAVAAPAATVAPVDADRLHQLTAELRCLVCQNESLADSTAPLALDLKREIVARMAAGDRDEQILAFLVERYGDFVTYRPPFTTRTWLLWLGPLVLLGAGAWVALRPSSRPGAAPAALRGDEAAAPASSPVHPS